ncbi:hypothetical protein [Tenacibaculum skagerrakense]|nr:hypothetical protein [Tenacibaculum skagerrakense]
MKSTIKKVMLFVLSIFMSNSLLAQEKSEKLEGYYIGYKDNHYTFSYKEVATGKKETIRFQYATPEVIETFSLKNDFFEGVFFEVTYFTSNVDGKYTYRIVDLKERKVPKVESELTDQSSSKTVKPEKLEAYFMGFKNNKYAFSFTEQATGKKETIYFNEVSERVSKNYDLQQEFFEGVHFEVTYITDTVKGNLVYIIVDVREIQEEED